MNEVRAAVAADLDEILRLNNDAVPAVSIADRDHLARLVDMAAITWVVDGADGQLAAFILLFEPGAAYESKNYAWFTDRFEHFLYVDRVVVAPAFRGDGLGARLYDAVAEEGRRRGSERVTAEVNVEPPNPGSSRFHRRHGFEAVGEQRFADDYAVEMLARPLD